MHRPQEELLDFIFWIRMLFALILGTAFGVVPVTGAIGNIRFVNHLLKMAGIFEKRPELSPIWFDTRSN